MMLSRPAPPWPFGAYALKFHEFANVLAVISSPFENVQPFLSLTVHTLLFGEGVTDAASALTGLFVFASSLVKPTKRMRLRGGSAKLAGRNVVGRRPA